MNAQEKEMMLLTKRVIKLENQGQADITSYLTILNDRIKELEDARIVQIKLNTKYERDIIDVGLMIEKPMFKPSFLTRWFK